MEVHGAMFNEKSIAKQIGGNEMLRVSEMLILISRSEYLISNFPETAREYNF
jgi:hypothetical protein